VTEPAYVPWLFTLPELAAYMQTPTVDEATAALLAELAESLIADTYGAELPDPSPARLRRIALEVTKRAYQNPNGYVSESIGDYSYTRGARSDPRSLGQSGVYLTDAERAAIVSLSGRSTVRTFRLVTPFEAVEGEEDADPFAVNPAWWS
jgi:hypothetical protein